MTSSFIHSGQVHRRKKTINHTSNNTNLRPKKILRDNHWCHIIHLLKVLHIIILMDKEVLITIILHHTIEVKLHQA